MKNLLKDERAVAYLLLVGVGLTIVVTGITYNFVSDFVDAVLASINSYEGTPLADQMDADTVEGGNFLMALFKMFLIPALFMIMYFAWTMAQKPVRPW